MKAIVCLDNHLGMAFNHRRVSSDVAIIQDIMSMIKQNDLWIMPYSKELFKIYESDRRLHCTTTLPDPNLSGYQFIEMNALGKNIVLAEIVVYFFNRDYPSDLKLGVDLSLFIIQDISEFSGHSHDKITRVIFQR